MLRRAFEPSHFGRISLGSQARIVSGRAALGTSARTLRPNRWPISASVARSAFESCSRPLNWAVRIRFSVTRYSFCANSSLSTVPVTKASMRAQFIRPPRQPTHDLCSRNPSQHLPVRLCRRWANHRLFYSFNFLAFRVHSGSRRDLDELSLVRKGQFPFNDALEEGLEFSGCHSHLEPNRIVAIGAPGVGHNLG